MSWLADKYNAVKLAWQRFERWERVALLRESEWRIPVEGTVEEFRDRLGTRATIVPKKEFFKRYKRRGTTELLGFCNGDEFGLKLPNSPKRLGHYLHGVFVRDSDFDYVYAQYRLLHHRSRRFLRNIHYFLFFMIFLLLSAVLASVLEIVTDAPAIGVFTLGAALLGVFVLGQVIFDFLFDWPILISAQRRDRQAREDTYRLLVEICGSPAPETNE